MGRRGWLGTRAGERGTTGCAHRVPQTARGRAASVVRWHRVPHCARQSVQADLITRRPGQDRLSQAIEAPSVAHVTTIRPPSRRDLPGDPRRVRAPSGRQRRTSSACETTAGAARLRRTQTPAKYLDEFNWYVMVGATRRPPHMTSQRVRAQSVTGLGSCATEGPWDENDVLLVCRAVEAHLRAAAGSRFLPRCTYPS